MTCLVCLRATVLLSALATFSSSCAAVTQIAPEARGAAIYERCLACHALAYDRTGPRHCGLFGRRAGTIPNFPYSDAMRRSKVIWSDNTLDSFLANPLQAMPGTAMGYAGVTNREERAALIAYLKAAGKSDVCKPNAGSAAHR